MIDLLHLIKDNPFLSGGMAVGLVSFSANYLKNIPSQLQSQLREHLLTTITVSEKQLDLFDFLEHFMNKSVDLKHGIGVLRYKDNGKTPYADVNPTDGSHRLFWFKNYPVWVNKSVPLESKGGESGDVLKGLASSIKPATFSISMMCIDRSLPKQFLDFVINQVYIPQEEQEVIWLYYNSDTAWYCGSENSLDPREKHTVIDHDNFIEKLTVDAEDFLSQRKFYATFGIPYHRGYVLYGPPGNGKTSSIHAIATCLKKNICMLSLTGVTSDEALATLLSSNIISRSLLVIEDIDCLFNDRNAKNKDIKISFSGLLNALDGLRAAQGMIVIMTTNHLDKLDPALLRPGRADRIFHVPNATALTAEQLFVKFYGETDLAETFASLIPEFAFSMSKLQGYLLGYKGQPELAIANIHELLKDEPSPNPEISTVVQREVSDSACNEVG